MGIAEERKAAIRDLATVFVDTDLKMASDLRAVASGPRIESEIAEQSNAIFKSLLDILNGDEEVRFFRQAIHEKNPQEYRKPE